MEDDLKFLENGRRPPFFGNGRRPNFLKIEDNLMKNNATKNN
jgi:hypothetical protein